MRQDARIAIVGGSLVGPATELMLRKAGFTNVTTFEASKIVEPTSGGVMGIRPDVLFKLEQLGFNVDDLVALHSSAVISHDVVQGSISVRGSSMFPGKVASWDMLHKAFASKVNIQHGKRVISLNPTSNGAVLCFSDGTEYEFDLVIGADGRKSTLRGILDPDRQLSYQEYMVWRGLSPEVAPGTEGFHRYYDQPNGTLFSLTEPIIQGPSAGLQYFEYSHNLPADQYTSMAGKTPEERAYLLPFQITDQVRDQLYDSMDRYHLPQELRPAIDNSVSLTAIPVNDLPAPTQAHWKVGKADAVLLGDALVPVRLQVGVGLNNGLKQAHALVAHLAADQTLRGWERHAINRLNAWVELGRSRAHRSNLGVYTPVRPGKTAVPSGGVWDSPKWVPA